MSDINQLGEDLDGEALGPGDDGWDGARSAWNLAVEQTPAGVVLAESRRDLVRCLDIARENGLVVAPQASGHGAPSLPDLSGAVLLRTGRMNSVEVDAAAGTATCGPGALWKDVIGPASEHGLTALHGSSGTVGVAGYLLGGGLGWQCRRHGLACDSVIAFDVVTADGTERRVDAGSEPELFWALRGGGGAQALVSSIEFRLMPLRTAYAGSIMWPMERAAEVVTVFRSWVSTVPESLTSTLKLIRFPPVPEMPPDLRGRAAVIVTLAFAGGAREGEELVEPLRAVDGIALDNLAEVPARDLAGIAGDPEDPAPGIGDCLMLDGLPAEAADALLELAGPGAETPLLFVELRHLGGALRRPPEGHGAPGAIEEEFVAYAVGMPTSPEAAAEIGSSIERMHRLLGPWSSGRTMLTLAEGQAGTRGSFPPEDADRLARVKRDYDPDGIILGNHRIE